MRLRPASALPSRLKPAKRLRSRSTIRKPAHPCKQALADESIAKTVHDYKSAMHVFGQQGLTLAGVQHDPLLYGYLLDPTYSTYGLRETAFSANSI